MDPTKINKKVTNDLNITGGGRGICIISRKYTKKLIVQNHIKSIIKLLVLLQIAAKPHPDP